MNKDIEITCTNCGSIFLMESNLIAPGGILVECSVCNNIFTALPALEAPPAEEKPAANNSEIKILKPSGIEFSVPSLDSAEKALAAGDLSPEDKFKDESGQWIRLGTKFPAHDNTAKTPVSSPAEAPEPLNTSATVPEFVQPASTASDTEPIESELTSETIDENDFVEQEATKQEIKEESSINDEPLTGLTDTSDLMQGSDDELDDDIAEFKSSGSKSVWMFLILLALGGGGYYYWQEMETEKASLAAETTQLKNLSTFKTVAPKEDKLSPEKLKDLQLLSKISLMSLELEELHLSLFWTKDAKKKDPKSALSSKYKTKLSELEKASVRLKDVKNFEEYRDMVKIHSDALLGRTAIKAKLKGPKSGEFHNFFYRLKAAHTIVKAKPGAEIKEEEYKEINDILENIPDFDKINPTRPYLLLKIHSLLGLGAVKEAASLSGSLSTELKAVIEELNQADNSKEKTIKADKEEPTKEAKEEKSQEKPVAKKAKAKKKANKPKVNLGKYKIYISSANKKLDQGNTQTAVQLYKKALGVNPKKGTKAMLGLGWSYLDLGNNRQAEKYFKMAKGANPRIGESYWGLAEVYGAMKKAPLKKMMCREYLRVAPKGPEAAIARRCAK